MGKATSKLAVDLVTATAGVHLASVGIMFLRAGRWDSGILRGLLLGPFTFWDEAWRARSGGSAGGLYLLVTFTMIGLLPVLVFVHRRTRLSLAGSVAGWVLFPCLIFSMADV